MTKATDFCETPRSGTRLPRAVVTGGSGGIGVPVVRGLLGLGYEVVVLSRRAPSLCDPHLSHIVCDLADTGDIERAGSAIVSAGAPIAVLVHCAGIIEPGAIDGLKADALQRQIAVNFTAPVFLTSLLLPLVRRGGHIAFVNSLAAVYPLPESSVYAAAKAALRSFALALTIEAKPRKISVSSIFPGAVDTPMLEQEMQSGGSVLNFVNPPATPESVAATVIRAVESAHGGEYFRPAIDGIFGRICMGCPKLLRFVLPLFTWIGKRGMKRHARMKRRV
ncbi:SDR family NAD(P)-dependent oxidoreductase [Acetobacter sp.]|jgi:short-subunit dehydrogenase|uniref:SDR family NAD(P)-dependent oxidoreductase n=1 Tax=Acetobacter sp. TaxID=440 RepID=UPI0025BFDF1D|nr:SDR family oxidoreductase [Acetobacter sp.]MCH4090683.1 SDR family oxidoreductase [Acetobacter sp.]MCI1300126.1 SDR family oxidoreductase [Acetobacter sp.]MCI1316544.1 SDR family oxidoreductase [Acetobacter sp.]